jgi:hypothetical protein
MAGDAIFQLAALILAGGHDAGGKMRDSHGGFDFVHVLPSFSTGAIGVDFEICFVDFNGGILESRAPHPRWQKTYAGACSSRMEKSAPDDAPRVRNSGSRMRIHRQRGE